MLMSCQPSSTFMSVLLNQLPTLSLTILSGWSRTNCLSIPTIHQTSEFLQISAKQYHFKYFNLNPLRTIGSPVTHENWPMNWPNFAASPALLGWPARNRHTAACIHRFSRLLRTPPVPVVWIMSESRAVANEHEGHKRTIPIISSSSWMTVVLKGLYNSIFYSLHNPLRTIGSPVTHENWPMNWPNFAASPALLGWPARNRHTAACIHRFSRLLRTPPVPVVWIMSESRAVANEHEGHKRTIPIISSSFCMTVVLKKFKKLSLKLYIIPVSFTHLNLGVIYLWLWHNITWNFLIKSTLYPNRVIFISVTSVEFVIYWVVIYEFTVLPYENVSSARFVGRVKGLTLVPLRPHRTSFHRSPTILVKISKNYIVDPPLVLPQIN